MYLCYVQEFCSLSMQMQYFQKIKYLIIIPIITFVIKLLIEITFMYLKCVCVRVCVCVCV